MELMRLRRRGGAIASKARRKKEEEKEEKEEEEKEEKEKEEKEEKEEEWRIYIELTSLICRYAARIWKLIYFHRPPTYTALP